MDGKSLDTAKDKIEKLKELLPEAFTEGKIDLEKLQLTLGEDISIQDERYVLNWAGKSDAFRAMQTPTTATLAPSQGESVKFESTENVFIEGENLEVLKILQKAYYGKIKMIYIDPPYNTGNDSFVYPDRFTESRAEYLKRINDKDEEGLMLRENLFRKNSRDGGHYHSNWLTMMYPRLFMARNLLRDDGVIFVSIDDNEQHNLRLLMNDVFGEENFLGCIVRATGTTTGQDATKFGSSFDYCLAYRKTQDFQLLGLPLSEKDQRRFNNDDNDGKGKYALLQLRKTGNADRKEDRESMFYPVIAPDGKEIYPVGPGGYLSRWRMGKATYEGYQKKDMIVWKKVVEEEPLIEDIDDEMEEIIEEENGENEVSNKEEGIVIDNTYIPYVKYYLEGRTKRPSNLWTDIDGNKKGTIELRELFDGKKIFDNPKPTEFIRRLVEISCGESDSVLDFFAGSATTAHALLEINKDDGGNRKFIMVQVPEPTEENSEAFIAGYKNIAEIGKERIRRVIEKIKNEDSELVKDDKLDLGVKMFTLEYSNFKLWRGDGIENQEELEKQLNMLKDPVHQGTIEENMLFELLLKAGFPLTTNIEKIKVEKSHYFLIADKLVVALHRLNDNLIKDILTKRPKQFICLDRLFNNNDQLKTNTQLQFKDAGIEFHSI